MTAPDQGTPPGAIGAGGGLPALQGMNEADVRAMQRSPIVASANGSYNPLTNLMSNIGNLVLVAGLKALAQLIGTVPLVGDTLEAVVNNIADGINTAQSTADSAVETAEGAAGTVGELEGRVTALENGGTRTVYTSNFTWTNPGAGRLKVVVINGGQAGQNGFQGTTESGGAAGGTHGGYVLREFDCAELPSSVSGTVGAGGTGSLGAGGVSSFGSHLVGISGAPGSILTADGAIASSSTPGSGGASGADRGGGNGIPGGQSALAAGGTGGTNGSRDGAVGQSVSVSSSVPCGGGGGGGGYTRGGAFEQPGNGGVGGAPGGGGGGGGCRTNLNPAATTTGGPGANGRIILIYTPGATA